MRIALDNDNHPAAQRKRNDDRLELFFACCTFIFDVMTFLEFLVSFASFLVCYQY